MDLSGGAPTMHCNGALDLSSLVPRSHKQKRKSANNNSAYFNTGSTSIPAALLHIKQEFTEANGVLDMSDAKKPKVSPSGSEQSGSNISPGSSASNETHSLSNGSLSDQKLVSNGATYDQEYVLNCVEKLSEEVAGIKKSLVELPQRILSGLSAFIQAEIESQFSALHQKLATQGAQNGSIQVANLPHANANGVQVQSVRPTQPITQQKLVPAPGFVSANIVGNAPAQANMISQPTPITPALTNVSSNGVAFQLTPTTTISNNSPAIITPNAPKLVTVTTATNGVAQNSTPIVAAATAQVPSLPTISAPKYIQAPVQIRIEDLKADCNVHRVKILETIPPVDVFELTDDFVYRIFLKYKYPSIFVQALFVLHYGSFKAMHLNTSSRVKNNLELIPESFVNRLTLLVLRWFPSVEDLDFGKCLNQKQRSILSAARSCLFFKKCESCKGRNIDSLPSTYSIKNLPLIAAQAQMKKEAAAAAAAANNHVTQKVATTPILVAAPAPPVVNHALSLPRIAPTPPSVIAAPVAVSSATPSIADSINIHSDLLDSSDSLTSVFDKVAELVNSSSSNYGLLDDGSSLTSILNVVQEMSQDEDSPNSVSS